MELEKRKNKLWPFCLLFALCSVTVGIGYAAVSSVDMNIEGSAEAKSSKIFITEVNYKSNNNADIANSDIIKCYKTTMHSDIALSNRFGSSITYSVTVYNDTKVDHYFDAVKYLEEAYSNSNIGVSVSIPHDTLLPSKQSITFDVTFSFKTNSNLNKNTLDSFVNFKFYVKPFKKLYDLTQKVEEFVAPIDGRYKLQVWGAQGGCATSDGVQTSAGANPPTATKSPVGGFGSYSVAAIMLSEDEPLYVCVGGQGQHAFPAQNTIIYGGYNGGGNVEPKASGDSSAAQNNRECAGGGGATHIATTNRGELSNYANYKDEVLIVAGGGGGSYVHKTYGYVCEGGSAGGIEGLTGSVGLYGANPGTGGSQTQAGWSNTIVNGLEVGWGSFGQGGTVTTVYMAHGSAGGGGYYGGGASVATSNNADFTEGRIKGNSAGGGGSGYIGHPRLIDYGNTVLDGDEGAVKHMAAYHASVTSNTPSIRTVNATSSSPYALVDTAKERNGYAVITYIDEGDVPILDFTDDNNITTYNMSNNEYYNVFSICNFKKYIDNLI